MNLERRPFWLIGGIALTFALAFSACDNTSNSTTVDDEEDALADNSDSGRNSDNSNSGKDSVTVPTEMDTEIPVPTDLNAVRLSPSIWELSFKVSEETDGFVLQRLKSPHIRYLAIVVCHGNGNGGVTYVDKYMHNPISFPPSLPLNTAAVPSLPPALSTSPGWCQRQSRSCFRSLNWRR